LNEAPGYQDGDVLIILQLTAEQVDRLPPRIRQAIENLVAEFQAAGQAVPVSRPLSVIATEIDKIADAIADGSNTATPGSSLRAALELRADELRIRDLMETVIPRPPQTEPPPAPPSTCPVLEGPSPWAVIGGTIVILPRPDSPDILPE